MTTTLQTRERSYTEDDRCTCYGFEDHIANRYPSQGRELKAKTAVCPLTETCESLTDLTPKETRASIGKLARHLIKDGTKVNTRINRIGGKCNVCRELFLVKMRW